MQHVNPSAANALQKGVAAASGLCFCIAGLRSGQIFPQVGIRQYRLPCALPPGVLAGGIDVRDIRCGED